MILQRPTISTFASPPLLAECYIKLENYEKAYVLLKELLRQNRQLKDSSIYINYIRCCVETGRDKEASDA